MEKRMKASDVFANTHNPFVPKTNFEGAFPDIENISVEVIETDDDGYEFTRHYSKNNLGQFINCSNPKCYNGGFAIGDAIFSLNYNKQTEGSGDAVCQGYEGSPKGKIKTRSCEHKFSYKIKIAYKSEIKPPTESAPNE